MTRPLITGVSHICTELGSIPLDGDEQEGGVQAFSALLYQYGAQVDARILVGLWVAGVTVPRVIHALKDRNRAARLRAEEKSVTVDAPQPIRAVPTGG
jgi:hypothetical protein